jgi:DNA-binding response OmpR family regulator
MGSFAKQSNQPVVLVVDDDLMIRTLARQAMEAGGFRVEEAQNGEEALSLFERLVPSLVLLDVNMPEMDGFETCRQIRGLPDGQITPILIVTGLDDEASIDKAYDAGATDFATKPVNWVVLRHRVRYMIRAGNAFEARIRSEERSRALLNAIPAMVFQIDRDGKVLDYKPVRGVDTFVRPEDFVGRKLMDILPMNVAQCCLEHAEKALDTGETQSFEYSFSGSSGASQYEARIVVSGSDKVLGIVQDFKNHQERLHYDLR